MRIFDQLFRRRASTAAVSAMVDEGTFSGLKDPRLALFLQGTGLTESGARVTVAQAMKNTTVFRCVSLIAYSAGMLPLHLIETATKEKARNHPLFRLLHREPNDWQTAFDFRSLMQARALVHGNAYALIVRSGNRIIRLVPLEPTSVGVRQRDDWSLEYNVTLPGGRARVFPARAIFHLRGLSQDGIHGTSLVQVAAEAIGLAIQTEKAAARLFRTGVMVGGALKHPGKLSDPAYQRLQDSLAERYAGAENAHKWMVLEEGMEAQPFAQTARDGQHLEMRKQQVEEIARAFGVPRPLLGVDDTSWGSGIDVLGQFFVRYGLQPWFTAWEQAIERSLLSEAEKDLLEAKFNAGALIRGSMKDQADFFAKALGAGGQPAWLEVNEVRELLDMSEHEDGRGLNPGAMSGKERGDEPAPAT